MGTGYHGGFGNTAGSRPDGSINLPVGQTKIDSFFEFDPWANSFSPDGKAGGSTAEPNLFLMTLVQVFRAMHMALSIVLSSAPSNDLKVFLSKVKQKDFVSFAERRFGKDRVSVQEAYHIVEAYLSHNSIIASSFSNIEMQRWMRICKAICHNRKK